MADPENMAHTALLIIDIQNDYYTGGAFALDGAEAAGERAGGVLAACRRHGVPVVHVRHESVAPGAQFMLPQTEGSRIHGDVAPMAGEPVITKHYPNAFRGTGLQETLQALGIRHLVVAGMMSLMCVDATVRAAFDLGYECTVLHDGCAARGLEFDGVVVPAAQVHAAFMAALSMRYARMVRCAVYAEQLVP